MKTTLLGLSMLVASGSTFAAEGDTAVTGAINAAVTLGQSNYGLVVVGLIGLAALGFGLRAIMGAMRS